MVAPERRPLVFLHEAREGNTESREALLAAHYHPVRGYLTRRLQSLPDGSDTAEDLVQEVLVRNSGLVSCTASADPRTRFMGTTDCKAALARLLKRRRARS